jgi:hypothetical protein
MPHSHNRGGTARSALPQQEDAGSHGRHRAFLDDAVFKQVLFFVRLLKYVVHVAQKEDTVVLRRLQNSELV